MQATDHAILRRTRLRIGLFVGLTIGALLLLAGGISYAILVHSQEAQIQRELAWGTAHGSIAGPPACSWIFHYDGTTVHTGLNPPPPGFPLTGALDAVATTRTTETTTLTRNGTTYHIRTEARGDRVIQAVFDARFQLSDRRHLLLAFSLAAAVGVLAAMLTGVIVGRRAVAPLAEALTRQRRFVADASHELRTPIAQVHTRAQLMARRARNDGTPTNLDDLERLIGTTRRLGEVVDDLLLSARLAAAPADRPPDPPVDLTALIATTVAAETERAAERQITLALDIPADPLPVPGVESALRRVVGELLANALTHTPAGGRITVTLRTVDNCAELVIADTGNGFDQADARRIFDRFHRGPGSGDRRFGLGLALLQEVVTSHHGTIEAEGHPARGARFTVRLPTRSPILTRRAARIRKLRTRQLRVGT
ncbi:MULTISPECIES: HAMP domain-containing sensor histidine kinase [unclassified Micromonospora]|uniref:sensor histidine kinase n=1 Tax=unclassified Micromonospora TaxID=2617518 RepID=UPI001590F96D|nr:HAMP domain-containing sensor histidine kinase [Verrucosispora sp. NA02020]QKW13490.1 HAMP domain-containing histidine kinase [Verrucosispora sp. NA02020]